MKFSIRKKNDSSAAWHPADLEPLSKNYPDWLNAKGDCSEVVISTRIRLARNIANIPFPNCATHTELSKIVNKAEELPEKIALLTHGYFFQLRCLSEQDKSFLLERHLTSPGWIKEKIPAAVVISPDETVCIMINEEDHFRIQILQSGLGIENAWEISRQIDDSISMLFDYSYSDQYGYLTACPTNAGTGMRVSVAINLVGLALTNELDAVIKKYVTNDFTIRGFYGEGTDVWGDIFQISNQLTLGRTDEGILKNFEQLVQKLIEAERKARLYLMRNKRYLVEDRVFRAKAILSNARMIGTVESIKLFSYLRLGLDVHLISEISISDINQLMLMVQSAHLQKYYKMDLDPDGRDVYRASLIQKKMKL